jgi:hypothetical protein
VRMYNGKMQTERKQEQKKVGASTAWANGAMMRLTGVAMATSPLTYACQRGLLGPAPAPWR